MINKLFTLENQDHANFDTDGDCIFTVCENSVCCK